MSGEWMKSLAKAADRSTAGVYYMLKQAGAKAPHSELFTWTLLRAKGLPCKNYRPVADAVGKPEPPLLKANGKAAKTNGHAEPATSVVVAEPAQSGSAVAVVPRPIVQLAKLLGRPDKNNMNRIRYYLKQAGIKNTKKIDIAAALEVLARRGIDTSKFEYSTAPRTAGTTGSAKLIPDPADNYDALLVQYNELAARIAQAKEDIAQRDSKIQSLNDLRILVRDTLRKYQDEILEVGKSRFGGMPRPLEYPVYAYNDILEYERRNSKRAVS